MRGIAAVVAAIGDPWASLFTPPGSPDALLRRGPLRTGRARFPGIRLKQATRAAEVLLKFQRWARGCPPWGGRQETWTSR